MNTAPPEVGSWFRSPNGKTFEIVAVDEEDQTIEVQHFDGTLEEYELVAWRDLEVEAIDPPEDWSGSMDVDEEDLPATDETKKKWDDPLDFVDEYE